MSNTACAQCFNACVENDLLNDHNWYYHFYIYFRNRNYHFGAENYATIIKNLVKIDFYDEPEWWNEHFLPGIDKFMHNVIDEGVCEDLIFAIEQINSKEIDTDGYIKKLKARTIYINTKYKSIEESKFVNIIKNDLAYYKEKEKLRLKKLYPEYHEELDGEDGEGLGQDGGLEEGVKEKAGITG